MMIKFSSFPTHSSPPSLSSLLCLLFSSPPFSPVPFLLVHSLSFQSCPFSPVPLCAFPFLISLSLTSLFFSPHSFYFILFLHFTCIFHSNPILLPPFPFLLFLSLPIISVPIRRKKMMTASAVAETEYFIADEKEGTMILPPRRRALRPKAKVST